MHTFTRNKIALAVLMATAGMAQAAAPTAPAARTAKPIIVTAGSTATAQTLYAAKGGNPVLTVTAYFTASTDTAGAGTFETITDPAFSVNAGTIATPATDDMQIYYTDAAAAKVLLVTGAPTFSPNASSASQATGSATVSKVVADANGAFRINGANLEYTKDNTALPIVWNAVSAQLFTASANPIRANDQTGALLTSTAALAPVAAQAVVMGTAPDPKISTQSAAGAALINGLVIDTLTPVTGFATRANFTVATVSNGTCLAAVPTFNNGTVLAAADAAGADGAVVTATNGTAAAAGVPAVQATGFSAKNTITLTAPTGTTVTTGISTGTATASPDWTSGAVAADGAAYSSDCFNTGVTGANVPFTVTLGTAPTYTNVFLPATGVATVMAALPASAATDGAAPVITAATNTTGTLGLTFSEPMAVIGLADQREILENVSLSGTFASNGAATTSASLSAIALNGGLNPGVSFAGAVAGQSTLNITNLTTALTTGTTVSVSNGISYQESNDSGWVSGVNSMDTVSAADTAANLIAPVNTIAELGGGIKSVSTAIEAATATNMAITAPSTAVNFTDSTASAQTVSSAPTKVGTIVVSFPAGKEISFATGMSATHLANRIRVVILDATNSLNFEVFPTAAQLALDAAGTNLTITLPTDLIYSKIPAPTGMKVEYMAAGVTASVLVKKTSAATAVASLVTGDKIATGVEPVIMPLAAVATDNTIYTESVVGVLAGNPAGTNLNGSRVRAYLAKWSDTAQITSQGAITVKNGRVTNPGDKVATDLAIDFVDAAGASDAGVVLASAMVTEQNKAAPAVVAKPGIKAEVKAVVPKTIPVYVKLIRSADVQANTKGSQNYVESRALLATTYAAALAADGGANTSNTKDPIYEVNLDVNTGAITGRLTGQVGFSQATPVLGNRGLTFIGSSGASAVSAAAAGTVAEGTVGSAIPSLPTATVGYNLLLGIDTKTTDLAAVKDSGAFVLLVHEQPGAAVGSVYTMLTSADPSAANFLPFNPDLFNLTNKRAVNTAITNIGSTGVKKLVLPASTNWALFGLGSPARSAVPVTDKTFPRGFVGLAQATHGAAVTAGVPYSFWTKDGLTDSAATDMALQLNGNVPAVATELSSGTTLSTVSTTSSVTGAEALAWANDTAGGATATTPDNIFIAQKAAATPALVPKLKPGWSLVTVPTAGLTLATTDAVIKVGSQLATGNQYTWFKATDGTNGAAAASLPSLTAGEAVFVYSKLGGNL